MLSLQACAIGKPPPPVAAISAPAQATPAARIAEIKRQLARLCPTPLDDAALERAAAYVETHRDKDVVAIVDDLSRLDGESRICRGLNI
jgi:hypothetical protein